LGTGSSEIFFIVPARTAEGVNDKIRELKELGYSFIIVCGEKLDLPNVVYRKNTGKYDAINYGARFLRDETKIVCLNDVDTKIHNFEKALEKIRDNVASLVFCKLKLKGGSQVYFYSMMDRIRRRLQITSSGELMLIRRKVFEAILPLPPCKTEDNYILFKVLELGYQSVFCEDCWVETERTDSLEKEEAYKVRTVTGVYQALSQTRPKPSIRAFYLLLPFVAPLLLLQGKRGLSWLKGIIRGTAAFLKGDREGKF
jgi:cellulose synthase/poly-beta-1,6-N-acetylglucosamine synthase-like glycosyltransferase